MQKHVGMNDCFAVCGVHSHGRGSPGRGIPVHHHTGGHRSPALVPGAQPNLPVGSTIVEKARQPHQSESQEACPSMLRLSKLKCKRVCFDRHKYSFAMRVLRLTQISIWMSGYVV